MEDTQAIDLMRGLIVDGINCAQSGHPGGALSSLDFAYILFSEYLNFDPSDPKWLGRDRFILSAGHESMLLYSLLFASGWLKKDDLAQFRQWQSRTPGHPENTLTPGVECTTGPLGQGAAMSVGFAIAATHLKATFGDELFSHKIYSILGDGCMQEDVTSGAASLAGHLGLKNLIWYYDRNKIQISGSISRTTSVDEVALFKALGWQVLEINGHDHSQIREALNVAQKGLNKPLLIIGQTTMARRTATMEGSHHTHGSPLSKDERAKSKALWGIPSEEEFYWPKEASDHFEKNFSHKKQTASMWRESLAKKMQDSEYAKKYRHSFEKTDPNLYPVVDFSTTDGMPTRNAFGKILEAWSSTGFNLMGGSADLEPSNMTEWFAQKVGDFTKENPQGRNLLFGVREFAMSAICNGIALHGGLIPFDATFLVFSDYARPALRLGALQHVRVVHEYSHDSFYLGEDGPTHQPIEHLMALRAIPGFLVLRPADPIETAVLSQVAILENRPSAMCLSRQKLPTLRLTEEQKKNIRRGAYVLSDTQDANMIIIATGSEVSLAMNLSKLLPDFRLRIISMPCWELFMDQSAAYQQEVLPASITTRITIEAGTTLGWEKWSLSKGINIGIDHFGASAKAEHLAEHFGFTPEAIVKRIRQHFC